MAFTIGESAGDLLGRWITGMRTRAHKMETYAVEQPIFKYFQTLHTGAL